ncbi:hypothetical protein BDN71DRAFT_1437521 [Pleurotus eryngii]|uniref:F-box domain-containing protein n=1 Tax=Pleurotus eryngii TaxID=5323 RepID=A0A9P6AAG5_PLEER|nr:hypothetical protein BDN71DRAFT_1437521 [Pleurotus eryngii]
MLYRRNKSAQNQSTSDLFLPSNHYILQDGSSHTDDALPSGLMLLLDVPEESLLHITSYLEPPALLALGRVCKILSQHVKLDSTWLRAFATQCLAISPESDLKLIEKKSLMLRRSPQQPWRDLFIARYKLLRRWGFSGNSLMTHTPLNNATPGTNMQLACTQMPNIAPWTTPIPNIIVFSASSGAVCRSLPLTGKVGNVYLAPELIGVAHPCAISAHDGAGKALFGYPDGKVGLVIVQKAIDHTSVMRNVVPIISPIDVSHTGSVLAVTWEKLDAGKDGGVRYGASVALDNTLKVWDANRNSLHCLWSSQPSYGTSSFIAVEARITDYGIVVCGFADGSLFIWSGLGKLLSTSTRSPTLQTPEIRGLAVECPVARSSNTSPLTISKLVLDAEDPEANIIHVLVAYQDDAGFYRISVDTVTQQTRITSFGNDPSFGSISCLESFFTRVQNTEGRSIVVVGDSLGCINVYDWTVDLGSDTLPGADRPVLPISRFEAHAEGGKITAIAGNDAILITGSSTGEVKVWDSLNFALIREFGPRKRGQHRAEATYDEESIGQILLTGDKQVLVFNVGDRVVGWWAGPDRKGYRGGVRGRNVVGIPKKKKDTGRVSRGTNAYALRAAIDEFRDLTDDVPVPEGVLERRQNEREQRAGLASLGLSEAEAVEYVLMLSRDNYEEEYDERYIGDVEEGVFDNDFELDGVSHVGAASPRPSAPSPTPSLPTTSPPSSWSSPRSSPQGSHAVSWISRSNSNSKIQVSPRMQDEPREAGPTRIGKQLSGGSESSKAKAINIDQSEQHFPVMGGKSGTGSPSQHAGGTPKSRGSPSTSKSPSAWSKPLATSKLPEARGMEQPDKGKAKETKTPDLDDMDDDLRFAIELSLAEAASRECL